MRRKNSIVQGNRGPYLFFVFFFSPSAVLVRPCIRSPFPPMPSLARFRYVVASHFSLDGYFFFFQCSIQTLNKVPTLNPLKLLAENSDSTKLVSFSPPSPAITTPWAKPASIPWGREGGELSKKAVLIRLLSKLCPRELRDGINTDYFSSAPCPSIFKASKGRGGVINVNEDKFSGLHILDFFLSFRTNTPWLVSEFG